MAKIIKSFRFEPETVARLKRYAAAHGMRETTALHDILWRALEASEGHITTGPAPKLQPNVEVMDNGYVAVEAPAKPKRTRGKKVKIPLPQTTAPERYDEAKTVTVEPKVDLSFVQQGPTPSPPGSRLKPMPTRKSKWALS